MGAFLCSKFLNPPLSLIYFVMLLDSEIYHRPLYTSLSDFLKKCKNAFPNVEVISL